MIFFCWSSTQESGNSLPKFLDLLLFPLPPQGFFVPEFSHPAPFEDGKVGKLHSESF